MTIVTNRSSQRCVQNTRLTWPTASLGVEQLARPYRISADSRATNSAAEIPLPDTSANTTAQRPSGSGT